MQDVQQIINKIKMNDITLNELINYLDHSNILIKANAIFQLVKLKVHDELALGKLVQLAKRIDEEPKVLGQYNNGFFALAALNWLETESSVNKFEELVLSISLEKRSILTKLIEEKPYLYL